MNILCMNYEYPPIGGGGGAMCKGLAELMVSYGHEIDVVTSGTNDLPSYEEVNGVRIHRVWCIRRYKHYVTVPEMMSQVLPAYVKARSLADRKAYDLNHTHFVVPSGIVSYMLWKRNRIPYIITAHGSDIPYYNPDRFSNCHAILTPFWKRIIKNSRAIVCPSNFLKELMIKQIDIPVEVIPNGYPVSPLNPEESIKRPRILIVTRMFERKGVQYFLEVLDKIDTDWEVNIAGDGPYLAELKEKAKRVGPKVSFLGFLNRSELNELYNSSMIFVFPSIQENFPMVLLEAMDAACAIITTDAPGCREVVGDAAIQTRCGSTEQLEKALALLINNGGERRRLSRLGRARVQNFSWPVVARRYEEIMKRCML